MELTAILITTFGLIALMTTYTVMDASAQRYMRHRQHEKEVDHERE